ncbi:ROK family protein [Enterococcus sp. LJL98]
MKTYACIDIGGTMMKYGLVNEAGQMMEQSKRPTEAHLGGTGIMQKVEEIIEGFLETSDLAGIALSSAGMVDPDKGEIFYAGPQIPNYAGTQFKQHLEAKYQLPCEIENDVNCAGLAEVMDGAAKGSQVTLCLTIGTGIGGCILLGKEIFRGYSNSACEVGYMHMDGQEFQQLGATTALIQKVAQRKKDVTADWNGYRIFEAAQAGDVICQTAIDEMIEVLVTGIANICYVINPQVVVLGGGIMGQEDYLKERMTRALKEKLVPSLASRTSLTFAKHQNNAGLLGAFYHFMTKQSNNK